MSAFHFLKPGLIKHGLVGVNGALDAREDTEFSAICAYSLSCISALHHLGSFFF